LRNDALGIAFLKGKMFMYNRKNKPGAYGFSKYTPDGQVTYSESKDYYGNVVKHFYDYDTTGRRIYYAQKQDGEDDLITIMEEFTEYCPNGYKNVTTIFYKEKVINYRYLDTHGREIKTRCIDTNTGLTTEKEFDGYKGFRIKQYISVCVPRIA
jgi:hypothetical protein